jgi:sister chromatid cohesion protein DCC1
MSHPISLRRDEARTKEGRTKYRLLELPPDLCKLVETSAPDFKYATIFYSTLSLELILNIRLTVKGKEGDDAVICTPNKTYTLRSVNISNSLVVATGTGVSQNDISLSEDIHEIMELVPTMPKLDRLRGMLRGSEYGEDQISEDENDPVRYNPRIIVRRSYNLGEKPKVHS